LGFAFRKESGQTFQEVFTILIVVEYPPAFDPPDHDMMQEAGRI
jgi:hypothetical protein